MENRRHQVLHERDLGWQTSRQTALGGALLWKTLASGGEDDENALSLGLARIPPAETLRRHSHEQTEIYLILEGSGMVEVEGERHDVEPGSSVFVPGGASHCCENTGERDLLLAYVFPTRSIDEVEYVFDN